MLKLTRGVSVLVVCSIIGLTGCAGQKEDVRKAEPKVAEAAERPAGPKVEEPIKEAVPEPVVVQIKDPATGQVIQTFTPKEMGYETNIEQYKQAIVKWARGIAGGTADKPGYDKRGSLDRIDANGQIIKGEPRVILEEAELVEMVMNASAQGGEVLLPVYTTASNYAAEDAAHLGEVLLASYTTKFESSVTGRAKNIELSAQAINNVIVGAGDYFSFNTMVGPSDEAHGYQPAKEIVNKKLVMGIGGGICQTSSTLFNAVDQLGVEYVEKHHHSLTVGYVPAGRDATVSYGGKDFRFQNTSGGPFIIRAVYGKGTLTIEIRTAGKFSGTIKKRV